MGRRVRSLQRSRSLRRVHLRKSRKQINLPRYQGLNRLPPPLPHPPLPYLSPLIPPPLLLLSHLHLVRLLQPAAPPLPPVYLHHQWILTLVQSVGNPVSKGPRVWLPIGIIKKASVKITRRFLVFGKSPSRDQSRPRKHLRLPLLPSLKLRPIIQMRLLRFWTLPLHSLSVKVKLETP